MGGTGSGRRKWFNKKQTAEESKRLKISMFTGNIRVIEHRHVESMDLHPAWAVRNRPSGSIGLSFTRCGENIQAWAAYEVTQEPGEKTMYCYQVGLETTQTPWGSPRYWWTCPQCGSRAGVLYLPPGAERFLCRRCHQVTYTSCQKSHKGNSILSKILLASGIDMTPKELDALLDWERDGTLSKTLSGYLHRQAAHGQKENQDEFRRKIEALLESMEARERAKEAARQARFARYLSDEEMCSRVGLSRQELEELKNARLITADHEGKYRPKLQGWAKKLAYLLREGWAVEEIKRWANGRWASENPRQWPPEREPWTH